jgi:DNA-binding NtrC family response regulator
MNDQTPPAPNPNLPILILDDEESYRSAIRRELHLEGLDSIVLSGDPAEARALVSSGSVALVLLDLHMPGVSGEDLLAEFTNLAPQIPVIIVTGNADTGTTVRCIKAGALDYLVKPIETTRLLASIWNGLAVSELKREMSAFREKILDGLSRPELFRAIVTADNRMLSLFKYIEAIAPSRQPVLVTGETGTGKELFARAIHDASGRSGAFVAVNVGGLDDTVFSDTLFGHRKGAYTGAEGARPGLVNQAKGGTLFLDEIGDLEGRSQVKLLRFLQEGEYYPLGSDVPLRSDTRIVAATTHDLKAASAAGAFRSDLFYRLQTHPIEIPPLRKRRNDIGLLIDHFLARSAESLGRPEAPEVSRECREALMSYDFLGNVRELEGLIHDAVAGARGSSVDSEALLARLPRKLPSETPAASLSHVLEFTCLDSEPVRLVGDRFPSIKEVEAELLRMALRRADGNISLAASLLGISRQTVHKWLAETDGRE